MFNISEFNEALNKDLQRSNMFSVVFATTPSAKSQKLLSNFGGMLYDNIPFGKDFLGLTAGSLNNTITTVATQGTQKLLKKSGISKFMIGAMSSRVMQSFLGEFTFGTYVLDFFTAGATTSTLMVYSVKMPANTLNYEMDRMHHAPGIKVTSRDYEPLVISFRMDSDAGNFRAMHDWVNSVEDPITGLRALPSDVECDIQVNLHNRKGIPHTVCMFSGAMPMAVSAPELTYEGNNEIAAFDVTFAYRSMAVGAVSDNAIEDWIKGDLLPGAASGLGSMVGDKVNSFFGK